jgi:vancomycin resistance protein YoaR
VVKIGEITIAGNQTEQPRNPKGQQAEQVRTTKQVSGYQNNSGRRPRPRRSAKARKQKRTLIIVSVICLTLVLAAAGFLIHFLMESLAPEPYVDDHKILSNVIVAGINLGGMTKEQAAAKLHAETDHTYSQQDMVIVFPTDELRLTPDKTGARLDVDAVVEAAYAYGRTGTDEERQAMKEEAKTRPHIIALLQYLNLDREYIRSAINEYAAAHVSTLKDAAASISGTRPALDADRDDKGKPVKVTHQVITVTIGTPDFVMDPADVFAMVQDAYSLNEMRVTPECSILEPKQITAEELYAAYCFDPQDAYMDPHTYEIIPESRGYGFDVEKVRQQLANATYGETIQITMGYLEPNVFAEDLGKDLYQDILATHKLTFANNAALRNNLALAVKAINGYIIRPGATFSFNRVVGEPTAEKGYQLYADYKGTELVDVMGGGLSQAASTLYCSAVLAEMGIVSRNAYTYAPSFGEIMGTDAVAIWGISDMAFQNTSEKPVRIVAMISGNVLTISLEGTETRDYKTSLEYEILGSNPYKTIIATMDQENPKGYQDGDVLQTGINGFSVRTYLCKTSKKGAVTRSSVAVSVYDRRDRIVCELIIPIPDPTDPPTEPPTEAPTDPSEPTQPTGDSGNPTE